MPVPKFYLKPSQSHCPEINLPDGVEVVVGRNVLTRLKDFRLSRKHVSLTANELDGKVEVKRLGANNSFWAKRESEEGRKVSFLLQRKTICWFDSGQDGTTSIRPLRTRLLVL